MAKDEKKKKKPKFVKRKRGAMSKGEARTKRIRDDFDAEMAASSSEESEGGDGGIVGKVRFECGAGYFNRRGDGKLGDEDGGIR